jgi:hypothetical protein
LDERATAGAGADDVAGSDLRLHRGDDAVPPKLMIPAGDDYFGPMADGELPL